MDRSACAPPPSLSQPIREETQDSLRSGHLRIAAFSWSLVVVMILVGFVAARSNPVACLMAAALVFGWTQMRNMCGLSHLSTFTPMSRVPAQWALCIGLYTLGGLATSSVVGAFIGFTGRQLQGTIIAAFLTYSLSAIALALAVREAGWVSFPVPNRRCQTDKMWAVRFGVVQASWMWGAHIGLGLTTWVQYSGYWLLVLAILTLGRPTDGLLVIDFYWLGRCLPLLTGPIFSGWPKASANTVVTNVIESEPTLRRVHTAGLLFSSVIAQLWH